MTTDGLRPGELFVAVAPPGAGKSHLRGTHVPWCGGGHEGKCAPITLCGTPDGTERTVAEWDALHAQRGPKTPITERLVNLVFCPACFLPRFVPSHWFTCR